MLLLIIHMAWKRRQYYHKSLTQVYKRTIHKLQEVTRYTILPLLRSVNGLRNFMKDFKIAREYA
jgi:hypothetical protein